VRLIENCQKWEDTLRYIVLILSASTFFAVSTPIHAAIVTFNCVDEIVQVDTTKRTVSESGAGTYSLQQFDSRYLTYGMGQPSPTRIDLKTGRMYHFQAGAWVPDPDERPCTRK
jgi:hypothetical protein